MSNGIKRIYLALLTIAGILIIAAGISRNGTGSKPNLLHLKPDSVFEEGTGIKNYSFDVESKRLGGQGIAFFTNHQNVTVYCNNARFYELKNSNSLWGRTTGSVWHFVHLPYQTKEVHIRLE